MVSITLGSTNKPANTIRRDKFVSVSSNKHQYLVSDSSMLHSTFPTREIYLGRDIETQSRTERNIHEGWVRCVFQNTTKDIQTRNRTERDFSEPNEQDVSYKRICAYYSSSICSHGDCNFSYLVQTWADSRIQGRPVSSDNNA